MKYKQYQKMKDSGVEWIGEIPEEWEVKRLKYLSKIELSTVDRHVKDDEQKVFVCHYPDVYNNEKITSSTSLNSGTCTINEIEKFRLKKDDVLITKDSETADDIGVPTYVTDDLENIVCGYHIAQITSEKDKMFGGFLFYFIQSDLTSGYFEAFTNGITRYGMGKSVVQNLFISYPTYDEQEQIYDFLQKETSNFDDLISKSQSQVNLLQEKRQALINHAVTKGLDPTVPMKDSGIEWIGEVPEHWEVRRLKFLKNGDLMYGANEIGDIENSNSIRYVRITDIDSNGNLRSTNPKFLEYDIAKPFLLKDGDVLLARSGATVGKSFIYKKSWGKACFAGYLIRFRADHKLLNHDFFYFFTQSENYWNYINSTIIQATIQNVSAEKYSNLFVTVPPYDEQEQIYDFLQKETTQFDDLISKSQSQVKLLQEKREALITSAVTGKIDVRN